MVERIRFEGVSKQFPGRGGPTVALADVDLSVRAGEVYGLIGRSGAGKSTLLRTVNGLERPTSGRVLVDGVDVARLGGDELREVRRSIGMVFQQFSLWGSRTVYGNIAVPLRLAGWSQARTDARVAELVDFVGLQGKAFARPRHLSGGQKQRVGIARAIANQPSILLADEATSALDPQTTTEIVDLLRAVNRELGITIVVVTHEMDVVSRLADRVAVLSQGRVVETGGVHDVLSRPRHPESLALVASFTKAVPTEEEKAELGREVVGRRISVVVDEQVVSGPLISRLARENQVDFTVVHGGVARVGGLPYGQLGLAVHGDDPDVERFVAALSDRAEVLPW
ncbi:methionine ABC transporter ATP-binding protein [Aquipuribacter hungaricus]|uniref:Methionine ABC transporter ATP-binding protein n=1 Tax=Aquipuribacter hungaricus TaxID=545624 RepID=A0ABV7WDT2_9MICO